MLAERCLGVDSEPSGIDLAWWRRLTTREHVAGAIGFTLATALVLATDWGRELFGLGNIGPALLLMSWPVTFAMAHLRGERMFRRPWDRRLFALFCHSIAVFSSLGAGASAGFGPGWCLLLLVPPCCGHVFPGNRMLLAAIVVVPPLERALIGPDGGVLAAAAFAVFVAGCYELSSRRRIRERARERRSVGQGIGGANATETVAMLTAMRVHDRLSDLFVLARARAALGSDRDVLIAGAMLVEHTRGLVAELQGETKAGGLLRETLGDVCGQLSLRIEEIEITADDDSNELRQLLVDLLAHQADSGGPVLKLSVAPDPCGVCVALSTPTPVAQRRRRWRAPPAIARRVRASGGSWRSTHDEEEDVSRIEIVLPTRAPASLAWTRIAEGSVHLLAPLVAFVCGASMAVIGALGVVAITLAVLQLTSTLRSVVNDSARGSSSMTDAAGAAVALVCQRFAAPLDTLEAAVAAGRLHDVRVALGGLSNALTDILSVLEVSAGVPAATPPAQLAAVSQ